MTSERAPAAVTASGPVSPCARTAAQTARRIASWSALPLPPASLNRAAAISSATVESLSWP